MNVRSFKNSATRHAHERVKEGVGGCGGREEGRTDRGREGEKEGEGSGLVEKETKE